MAVKKKKAEKTTKPRITGDIKTITRKHVAYMLGVTHQSITDFQNQKHDPLPIAQIGGRGRPNAYDLREVLAWCIRREKASFGINEDGEYIDYNAEKARLTKAQADGQELKNNFISQKVVPVKLLELALYDITQQVKSILESIPVKIKQRVPKLTASEIEVVKREIVKCQNAASKTKLDFDRVEELIKEIS